MFESRKNIIAAIKNRDHVDSSAADGLKPGDDHYRSYVGPPDRYDLISAMVFNLLTCSGLRQGHKVLDIGCGSLRVGRLLIPYLNKNCYCGVEPNKWLVFDGLKNEVGLAQYRQKKPEFLFQSSFSCRDFSYGFDYCFAQSIFSHCGVDLVENWFEDIAFHSHSKSVFFATFVLGEAPNGDSGWIYPGCVKFSAEQIFGISTKYGFDCLQLNWFHPFQTWFAFYRQDYNHHLLGDGTPAWNLLK